MTTVTNRLQYKSLIKILTNTNIQIIMSYWKGESEMSAKEKKNAATRRFRENEKLHEMKIQADIVRLEWQIHEEEKKVAFQHGRTQVISSQAESMKRSDPFFNTNQNFKKAEECIAKANQCYWDKK